MAMLAGDTTPKELEVGLLGGVETRLTVYGIDPQVDPDVRVYKMTDGEWLTDDLNLYEIVLVKDFADDEAIEVGEDLGLITPNGIELVRVVGLISKEGAGQLNNGMFGAMPLGAVQRMFNRAGDLDQIDIVVTDEVMESRRLESLRDELGERLGGRFSVTFPASQGERVSQMLFVYQAGLGMFGVIAVFVGAFLIYNAFSMTVVERTREIGMMRTIGMTRGQVGRQILAEAVVLGALGSGLGVGAGIVLASGLITAMAGLLATDVPEVAIPTSGIVNGVMVGLVATLLAALVPAYQAGRVSPLEAPRARSLHKEGWFVRRGWILGALLAAVSLPVFVFLEVPPEAQFQVMNGGMMGLFAGATLMTPLTIILWERAMRPLMRFLFGGEARLGARNIRRARMRTTMTVTALMVGVAMLLSMRAMSASFQTDLGDWIDGYMGGEIYTCTPRCHCSWSWGDGWRRLMASTRRRQRDI